MPNVTLRDPPTPFAGLKHAPRFLGCPEISMNEAMVIAPSQRVYSPPPGSNQFLASSTKGPDPWRTDTPF